MSTRRAFTGKSWKYQLELPANAIGDFNLIDATSGLIIERDDSEGDPAQACLEGAPKPDCFNVPAKFKRIYKIDFAQADADGFVKKVGYIDLMDIDDPQEDRPPGRARRQAHLPVLHHRECRHRRRRSHHRRQRQQPALLVGPRARQVRRQRADPAEGHRPFAGEVARLRIDRLAAITTWRRSDLDARSSRTYRSASKTAGHRRRCGSWWSRTTRNSLLF